MTDVWAVYGQLVDRDPSTWTPAERSVVAICDLRQEVNAGGFEGYFSAWGGDSAPEALAALPGILGDEWATLLRTAMAIFGSSYPADADARQEALDRDDLGTRLSEVDDRFYALEASTDADVQLSAHLGSDTA